MTFLAPQAAGGTWYPYRFIEPVERNEPGISSGLQMIDLIYSHLKKGGLGDSGIFLLGFSQGACLALEYAARNPRNYGGVFGLSGGLIGDSVFRERYSGSFNKIPVFLGCSDKDPHIPLGRVEETAKIFKSLGAVVEMRIYQGMGHTVNLDEIKFINETISEKTIV
jgi:predicted esterase